MFCFGVWCSVCLFGGGLVVSFVLFRFVLFLPCLRTKLTMFRGKLGLVCFFLNLKAPEPLALRSETH